jgi:hypothetical protein
MSGPGRQDCISVSIGLFTTGSKGLVNPVLITC